MRKIIGILMLCLFLGACSFGVSRTYTVNGEEVSKREYDEHKKQMQTIHDFFNESRKNADSENQ